MVSIGRGIRWYKDGEFLVNNIPELKVEYIKKVGFPVIIHPVSEKTLVNDNTEYLLVEQVKIFSEKAKNRGIIWYLENNSVVDTFHYNKNDLSVVFQSDSYVEQLLDVAHIDNYQHLKEIIDVKFPKCLHVAGKHFDVPHEHLPLNEGDIDYKFVFRDFLNGYKGRVILEVDGNDEELIMSKRIIEEAIR